MNYKGNISLEAAFFLPVITGLMIVLFQGGLGVLSGSQIIDAVRTSAQKQLKYFSGTDCDGFECYTAQNCSEILSELESELGGFADGAVIYGGFFEIRINPETGEPLPVTLTDESVTCLSGENSEFSADPLSKIQGYLDEINNDSLAVLDIDRNFTLLNSETSNNAPNTYKPTTTLIYLEYFSDNVTTHYIGRPKITNE